MSEILQQFSKKVLQDLQAQLSFATNDQKEAFCGRENARFVANSYRYSRICNTGIDNIRRSYSLHC